MNREQWEQAKQDRIDQERIDREKREQNHRYWEQRRISQDQQSKAEAQERLQEKHDLLVEQGRQIVQASNTFYIDLDVEADGKPGYGSLLSVGAVTPGGETFYRELAPASDDYIPSMREFCENHGLERERLLNEGVPAEEAMYDLDLWVQDQRGDKPAVLSAFNASFDFGWIDLEMARAGIETNPFGVAGFCLKSLAMSIEPLHRTVEWGVDGGLLHRHNRYYDWRSTTKSELEKNKYVPELVPYREFTHNALEDAQWQQELHFALAAWLHMFKTPTPYKYSDDTILLAGLC